MFKKIVRKKTNRSNAQWCSVMSKCVSILLGGDERPGLNSLRVSSEVDDFGSLEPGLFPFALGPGVGRAEGHLRLAIAQVVAQSRRAG